MREFISALIGNDYLATLLMSFIPLIELKGGIVFAWDKLNHILAFLLAYVGSTSAFFLVYFLLKPILILVKPSNSINVLLNLLKKINFVNKIAIKIEKYFSDKATKTLDERKGKNKKGISEKLLKQLGVFIFVAIPLPMTGVWTGTAIAVFLDLKFSEAVLPAVIGNFIAGLLICLLSAVCNLVGVSLDLVLWILLGLAVVLLIVFIVKVLTKKSDGEKA